MKKIKDGAYSFKWTNDVFFNSKKLCGILIERVKDDFVVGIGINVANKIPEDIKNIAISLESDYDIDKLILKVVEEFSLYYEKFMAGKWQEIIEEIRVIFEKTPPELAADIKKKGIYISGGGALLRGIDKKIASGLNLKVTVAEDPLNAVINGIGVLLNDFSTYSRVLVSTETEY